MCLIGDAAFRRAVAIEESGLSDREAQRALERADEDRAVWTELVAGTKDPWSATLHDMVVPMDKTEVDKAADLVVKHLADPALRVTDASQAVARDFLLAARVEAVVTGKGHDVAVSAKDGVITLTINKKVLLLDRLETELRAIAAKVDGVRDVTTKVGKGFYQTDIYRRADFEMPTKVLLVDDEREFVQTLSERLSMREVGSHVVYDGESAPGHDGRGRTGSDGPRPQDARHRRHRGLEARQARPPRRGDHHPDRPRFRGRPELCMKLGAFAYLQKPVDIELLSETLKKANEKVRLKKTAD